MTIRSPWLWEGVPPADLGPKLASAELMSQVTRRQNYSRWTAVQIVRIYSGSDGESHFEDLTWDQFAEMVNKVGDGPITLERRASPSFEDYHPAPRRQYVVSLSGVSEFETADGSKRRLGPGDVLVAEDLTGHGHIARCEGDELEGSLAVPLAD